MNRWLWRGLYVAAGVVMIALAFRLVQVQSLEIQLVPTTTPQYAPRLDVDFSLNNALDFLKLTLPSGAVDVQVVAYEEATPGYLRRLVLMCFQLPTADFDAFIATLDWAVEWQTRTEPFYARHRRASRDGMTCLALDASGEYQVAQEQSTGGIGERSTVSNRQIILDRSNNQMYRVFIEGDFYFRD